MTLENPQNILLKINSIQDNIKYLDKPKNILIKPIIIENSLINSSHNVFQDFPNYFNKDIKINDENLFQNNVNTQTSSNFKTLNKPSISLNSFDDSPFKKVSDSTLNFGHLNDFHFQNKISKENNKLIHSKLYNESNIKSNKKIIKNTSLSLNTSNEKK